MTCPRRPRSFPRPPQTSPRSIWAPPRRLKSPPTGFQTPPGRPRTPPGCLQAHGPSTKKSKKKCLIFLILPTQNRFFVTLILSWLILVSKALPRRSETAQDAFKRPPRAPKTRPRRLQERPNCRPKASRRLQDELPRCPQEYFKCFLDAPKTPPTAKHNDVLSRPWPLNKGGLAVVRPRGASSIMVLSSDN